MSTEPVPEWAVKAAEAVMKYEFTLDAFPNLVKHDLARIIADHAPKETGAPIPPGGIGGSGSPGYLPHEYPDSKDSRGFHIPPFSNIHLAAPASPATPKTLGGDELNEQRKEAVYEQPVIPSNPASRATPTAEDETLASRSGLKPVDMDPSKIDATKYYVWVRDKRISVVRLNDLSDGIIDCGTRHSDEWYFSHNLIGQLYGPIKFSE